MQHFNQYQKLQKKLRQARHKAGLTQSQAARLLRRTQAFVSKSERGERRVDIFELQEFARIYRKPLSYFLDE